MNSLSKIASFILINTASLTLHFPVMAEEKSSVMPETPSGGVEDSASSESKFQLARKLLLGKGMKKDVNKAFDEMKSAADMGHADAIGGLGYFYSNGIAVEKNEEEAVKYFTMGAEKGSAKAMLNLGIVTCEGKGIAKDESAGRALIQKAAETGNLESIVKLGQIYYFGDYGQAEDRKAALPWLLKAAEQGDDQSQNMVGVLLEGYPDIPMDLAAAENWYRKSALQGNAKAQANVGRIIGPAHPDAKKRVEAFAWLMIARDNNEITAIKILEDELLIANPEEIKEANRRVKEIKLEIEKLKKNS